MCHGCNDSADEPYRCTDADTGGGIQPPVRDPDRVPFVIRPPKTCTATAYDGDILLTCDREPHEDHRHQQYNAAGVACLEWHTATAVTRG